MAYKIKTAKKKEILVLHPAEYYQITITETSKPFGSKDAYSNFDKETFYFKSKEEADNFLKDRYGKVKKMPMYQDTLKGDSVKVGYIYGFKNKDMSHNSESWLQQDWVSINKINSQPVI